MSGLIVQSKGQILEIIIDRPKANVIDSKTSRELNRLFLEFDQSDEYRVAILTAAGQNYFCTGADLKELDEKHGDVDYGPNGFAGLTHFTSLSKPVIAAVNGVCVGGGFEMMLACDLIVSSQHAEFFLSETLIGNVPFLVSIQRLLGRLPRNIAMEMLYTGRRMASEELLTFGVINSVVPAEHLRETAYQLAEQIIAAAPLSVSACKQASALVESISTSETAELSKVKRVEFFDSVMSSEDAKEGARAFVEKRKPTWRGC
ncbi:enoyl-CoA hydratase-related protein [Neptunomonas sp.]|uniref:enoyl-CoA hydratase-related protein n=1 Tax=Neptunomonas sp. TaxID=1971898 RepID=UPI003565F8A3